MAYIIYKTDGTVLLTLAVGDVDNSTTSLDLIGKNVDNYGQYANNNLVRLLTNFAYETEPRSPQLGQLWYDTTNARLNVYNGTAFNPPYGVQVSGTTPTLPSEGDLWYDTISSQLKIRYGSEYKIIGPDVSAALGKFGISTAPTTLRDADTDVSQDVGVMYSYGTAIGLLTAATFNMTPADSVNYFNTSTTSTVVKGVTALNDIDVKGDLYINGIRQIAPIQTLTTYYDVSAFGDPSDPINLETGNIAIGSFLAQVFSTATNVAHNEIAYPLYSDARVVCNYNSTPSVRRFQLIIDPLHPTVSIWKSYDVYYNSGIGALTNIVVI